MFPFKNTRPLFRSSVRQPWSEDAAPRSVLPPCDPGRFASLFVSPVKNLIDTTAALPPSHIQENPSYCPPLIGNQPGGALREGSSLTLGTSDPDSDILGQLLRPQVSYLNE
ncbi:uncharacterized protein LOC144804319 [Lissotriton helveticus]